MADSRAVEDGLQRADRLRRQLRLEKALELILHAVLARGRRAGAKIVAKKRQSLIVFNAWTLDGRHVRRSIHLLIPRYIAEWPLLRVDALHTTI